MKKSGTDHSSLSFSFFGSYKNTDYTHKTMQTDHRHLGRGQLAVIGGMVLLLGLLGIGIVTFPASSLAEEREGWREDAKTYGGIETVEPPGVMSYLYAGAEFVGRSLDS